MNRSYILENMQPITIQQNWYYRPGPGNFVKYVYIIGCFIERGIVAEAMPFLFQRLKLPVQFDIISFTAVKK